MNKKTGTSILLVIATGVTLLMLGCSNPAGTNLTGPSAKPAPVSQNIECGGTTNNTDYDAPKEIKSDKLTSFSVGFFHYGDYGKEGDGYFRFVIEPDESGKLILKDGFNDETGFEVDETVLDGVQEIIKKYDLAKQNGIDKHTAGLPPEFETCYLQASYDSGETLNFSYNSNPDDEWTAEVRDYFAKVYSDNGDDKYLPPEETKHVVRCKMEFTIGDIRYAYDEILIPVDEDEKNRTLEDLVTNGYDESKCETKIYYVPWDRSDTENPPEEIYFDPTPEYYEGLYDLIEETNLKKFANGYSVDMGFDYEGTPNYYEFFIEFEYGNRLMGFSDDPEVYEEFQPVAEKIKEYMDSFMVE